MHGVSMADFADPDAPVDNREHDYAYAYTERKYCLFPDCEAVIMNKSTTCREHREWYKRCKRKAEQVNARLERLAGTALPIAPVSWLDGCESVADILEAVSYAVLNLDLVHRWWMDEP